MKNNREAAISFTLGEEGGYSNDASDPGGPTNYGITIADVRRYLKPGATAKDVKALTKEQAIEIYRNKYWKTTYYDCDKLAAGVDLSVFDFGVNSGPARASKYLAKAVGGTDTETINKLNDARLAFLKGLSTWSVFGKGWGSRVRRVRARALQMSADALKPSDGSKTRVGIFATLTAAVMASYHWILDHRTIVVFAAIFAALTTWEIIRIIRKGKANDVAK